MTIHSDQQITMQRSVEDMLAVAQNRDKQAFSNLFDRFHPKVMAYCLSMQPGATLLAEEVAQEVMLKVWNKAQTYNPRAAAVSTWIFQLARNARVDYLRKNGRHLSAINPDFIWDDIADEHADPFIQIQQKRDEDAVRQQIKTLPEAQMQVLNRVYMEGKTHQEVATVLKLPIGTVKSRIRLALKKLSISLPRDHHDQ